jgi:hypothetical protein
MRPALDTLRTGSRTGARYLSPALVSSPAPVVRARLYGHPRAYLAATIATVFNGVGVRDVVAKWQTNGYR